MFYFRESVTLAVDNRPDIEEGQPISESVVAGNIPLKNIRAVYPLVRAMHSNKVTGNNTLYLPETLIGSKKKQSPTGHCSFVTPYAKPVIREHNLQGDMFNPADTPMGRIICASYSRKKADELVPSEIGVGFLEGDGCMKFVLSISEEEAINRVMGGQYHTVSIGSIVDSVIESISGQDLIQLRKQGKEMPPFEKGNYYEVDGKQRLSYWTMKGMRGREISFVNNPSDIHAGVETPDIGEKGISLLLGEKPVGRKEFVFYDIKTEQKVLEMTQEEYFAFAPGVPLIDSTKIKEYYWFDSDNQAVAESLDADSWVVATEAEKPVEAVEPKFKKGQLVCWELNGEKRFGRVSVLKIDSASLRPLSLNSNKDIKEASFLFNSRLENLLPTTEEEMMSYLTAEETQNESKETDKPTEVEETDKFAGLCVKNLSISELESLKSFFFSYLFVDKTNKEKIAPLLVLKEKNTWTVSDYEIAHAFKKASGELKEDTDRILWGLRPMSTVEMRVSKIISEVINGE